MWPRRKARVVQLDGLPKLNGQMCCECDSVEAEYRVALGNVYGFWCERCLILVFLDLIPSDC